MLFPALDLHLVLVQRFPQGLGPLEQEQVEAMIGDGIPIPLVQRRDLILSPLQQERERFLKPFAPVAFEPA